jgi:hypothetical protein
MAPIRSLEDLDSVQQYERRKSLLLGALLAVVAVLLVLAVWWGAFR